jgi:hypothetical protein
MRSRRLTVVLATGLFVALVAAGCTLSSGSQYEIDTNSTQDLYLTLYQVPTAQIAVFIYENGCGGNVICTKNWLEANVQVPGSWSFLGTTVTAEEMWDLALESYFNGLNGQLYGLLVQGSNPSSGGPCLRTVYVLDISLTSFNITSIYWTSVGKNSSTCKFGSSS